MKHLLLILGMAWGCTGAMAQNVPSPDFTFQFSGNEYHFEDVVKVDTAAKKADLYNKTLEWFAKTFKDGKSLLQMEDKESGTIIAKGCFPWTYKLDMKYALPTTIYVYVTIKIQVKDGRYKYELSDFNAPGYGNVKDGVITKYPSYKMPLVSEKKIKENADYVYDSLKNAVTIHEKDIERSLKAALAAGKNDNW